MNVAWCRSMLEFIWENNGCARECNIRDLLPCESPARERERSIAFCAGISKGPVRAASVTRRHRGGMEPRRDLGAPACCYGSGSIPEGLPQSSTSQVATADWLFHVEHQAGRSGFVRAHSWAFDLRAANTAAPCRTPIRPSRFHCRRLHAAVVGSGVHDGRRRMSRVDVRRSSR